VISLVAMTEERSPQALGSAMRSIEAAFLLDGRGATLEGATEVWLVRHGDCYEGIRTEDPVLSPRGREQAGRLAERIGRLRVDAVYASPLRRARETADAIARDVWVDDRLVEVETELDDGGHVRPSELPEQVLERMRAAISDAVAAHAGGRVVMVGHALSIMAYLCDVLRVEFGTLRLLPYYTSVNIVRVLGDRRMVGSLADVAHLEG
jgi:2,3-bisphosphoglycerate-dependent phosphoglycerate mutase